MMTRVAVLGGLLLAALALTVSAQKDREKEKAKVYKTPQEVFDAFLAALNKRDSKAFVDCLAPEVVKTMASAYALQGVTSRAAIEGGGKDGEKDEKLAKQFKPVFDVLDKHGLTSKATKDIKVGDSAKEKEKEKARTALLALIKDPGAFVTEYQIVMDKIRPRGKEEAIKAKLTDVKIDGNKATGTVVDLTEKNPNTTFEFVKVGQGWKLNPNPRRSQDDNGKDKKDKRPKEDTKKDDRSA